jgi:hypothetical protein
MATGKVDLTHHPPADELGWPCAYLAHQLMPGGTTKAHITLEDLHVRRTDASQPYTDQRRMRLELRCRIGSIEPEALAIPVERLHVVLLMSLVLHTANWCPLYHSVSSRQGFSVMDTCLCGAVLRAERVVSRSGRDSDVRHTGYRV